MRDEAIINGSRRKGDPDIPPSQSYVLVPDVRWGFWGDLRGIVDILTLE